MTRTILVVGELRGGQPSSATRELLGAASQIAAGGPVGITLLGAGATSAASACTGATVAYVNDSADYDAFRAEQWLAAIGAAMDALGPDTVLVSQDVSGRQIAPRLAHRRSTAAAMDCTQIADDGGVLRVTRPAYGGNALATYTFATAPAIVTVREKSFDANEAGSVPTDIVALPPPGPSRVQITKTERAAAEGLRLEDAPIVVSGGRGLGGPEGFEVLKQLVDVLGRDRATLGASRAAVDLGWCSPSIQVGLTGKVVAPNLYIAIGISGASQHMAGCAGSRAIVVINRDADANMLGFARYALIGDYRQIVPALVQALRGD